MCTPVVWHSVADHSIAVRPAVGERRAGAGSVQVHRDEVALRDFCRENLGSYWAGWARRGADGASRTGMALLTDWGIAWCVLGVLRLRYTIATGAITSKSGAGSWALAGGVALDAGEPALVAEALRLRHVAEPLPPADLEAAAIRRDVAVAFLRRMTVPREEG